MIFIPFKSSSDMFSNIIKELSRKPIQFKDEIVVILRIFNLKIPKVF